VAGHILGEVSHLAGENIAEGAVVVVVESIISDIRSPTHAAFQMAGSFTKASQSLKVASAISSVLVYVRDLPVVPQWTSLGSSRLNTMGLAEHRAMRDNTLKNDANIVLDLWGLWNRSGEEGIGGERWKGKAIQ
jgi:hypothetical protein